MKGYGFQIVLGLLLCVSTAFLSQTAGTLKRIQIQVDQVETKVEHHCENFSIHKTN